jgi:hypothetical protein
VSHKYDDFLWRLCRGPILIEQDRVQQDGEMHETGRYYEVMRAVVRLEFAGFQYRSRIPRPYVRVIYSCGHASETTIGQYNWQKPPKTAVCSECSLAAGEVPGSDGGVYESQP